MKKIEIKSLFDFKFVSAPSFSPDGRYATFTVQTASYEENKYFGDIWLLEVDKKTVRQLTHEGNVKSASWKKNGNILLPAPLDEDMKKRVNAGEELSAWREVTLTGETVDFFTIPAATSALTETDDGRYVFVTSYDNNRPSLDGLDDEQRRIKLEEYNNSPCVVIDEIPFWTNGGSFNSGKRSRLSVYDKKTDTLTAITSPWFSTIDFDVRGSKVIYKGMEWKNKHIHNTRMGMWLYDIDSGDLQCVLDDDKLRSASFTFMDDKNVLITATDEIPYGVYQYKDFYNLNLETLEITKIAPYDNTTARAAINSDARLGGGRAAKTLDGRYYFLTTVGASAYLLYLDRDGTLSHYLTPDGSCDSFDVNGEHILVSGMYGDKLAELYLDGEQVTHFNDEWSATHSISTPEFHKFTNSDGFDVHGWAMKPVGYVEGKKYPAILHIHGGPRTAFGTAFHHEMQLWANEGYFVFYCNPRGGDGRGNEFGNIVGKLGISDYNDIMEFADCMLERYPDADKDNFGVAGGSYGGFMTNWIIGHTDRFKAAVSQRSISSWITMQLVSDIGIWYTPDNIDASVYGDIEKVWWHSPLKYADKCTTPTLFIHSDADYRCNMVEGLSMFTALKMHGCEAKMCLFKGENHELSRSGKPRSRVRRMEEILSWFDSHLK